MPQVIQWRKVISLVLVNIFILFLAFFFSFAIAMVIADSGFKTLDERILIVQIINYPLLILTLLAGILAVWKQSWKLTLGTLLVPCAFCFLAILIIIFMN